MVNLGFHNYERRRFHKGLGWMIEELIRPIDHELAHSIAPEQNQHIGRTKGRREEYVITRFEKAGAWARH